MTQLDCLSVPDLLRLHGGVLEELRRRQIVRSGNAPSGDYCELLFSRAFGWRLEGNAFAGHDATDEHGVRYQIKSRRTTPRSRSRQLSFIRNLPARPFDVLAGVVLDGDFRVLKGALIPVETVQEIAGFVRHVNAWRLVLRDSVWELSGVRDVTSELKAAQADI